MTSTYKYYDHKGRRLAVFCQYVSPVKAELFIIPCSKEDQFVKAFAKLQYNLFLAQDKALKNKGCQLVYLPISEEDSELKTLIKYCEQSFVKYIHIYIQKPRKNRKFIIHLNVTKNARKQAQKQTS